MNTVFIVYKTDVHHSYDSRYIIGVATSKRSAIEICKAQAQKEGEHIDKEDLQLLIDIQQTQGYAGEGEFHFEGMTTDTLL